MSAEAWAIALHHSRARNATDKLVILGIANHDGDGGAWPSVATLAHYAVCDPRTVQRAVDRLEQLGEVRKHVQAGGTRYTADHVRPNLYEFLLRCPPDCDGTKQHRTRHRRPAPIELEGLDGELSTRVTPVSPGDTGVGGGGDTGVTRTSPRKRPRSAPAEQEQTARPREQHTGWDRACVDGKMTSHAITRRTGACAYCGARRTTWSVEL